MHFLAKVPYYGFVGFVGAVGLVCSTIAPFFDLMPGIGWCLIVCAILFFYLFTIEAPVVECEWAGWILTVGSTIVALSGVTPVNYFVWVLSPLSVIFALLMYYKPDFRTKVNQILFPKGKTSPKVRNSDTLDISIDSSPEKPIT